MYTRRSSRSNKGKHSKRVLDEVYDNDDLQIPDFKRSHTEEIDDDEEYEEKSAKDKKIDTSSEDEEISGDEDSEVKCLPCGTTSDNYDEETDKGGTMIQCDSCKTWQHAKCMGFKSSRSIPNKYKCNVCDPIKYNTEPKEYFLGSLKEKHRISSAKAFLAFFKKYIPTTYEYPEGFDNEKLATKWTLELENVIYKTASKKYNEESRRILFLIKRPSVIKQIIEGKLSFAKLVTAPPEEIDLDLKQYAEKVRQESIRRSVLTADDQSQRIRRTHKGEEVVEDVSTQSEDADVNIIGRNIDHRRFREVSPVREIIVDKSKQASYNYTPDEDEDEAQPEKDTENGHSSNEETKSSELSDYDPVAGVDDDDEALDYILTGKNKLSTENSKSSSAPSKEPLPRTSSSDIWSGRITFPEFASFVANGLFYSYTGYETPDTPSSIKNHNKYIKIAKEILNQESYEIEGRLDRSRADDYLKKIVATRDLCFIQINNIDSKQDYDRLYNYLLNKNKVGVLSKKPSFVKDSYLIAVDFNDPNLPEYLRPYKRNVKVGLFALYVVKKDYVSTGPSILKKISTSNQSDINSKSSNDNSALSNILQQLNQSDQNPNSNYTQNSIARDEQILNSNNTFDASTQKNNFLANLTAEQRKLLDEVCQQNPQIAENPEAYFSVLNTYLNPTSKRNSSY